LFRDDLDPGQKKACLRGRRFRHILDVQRVAVGEELNVGLCHGPIGKGRITRIAADSLEMDVRWTAAPPSRVDGILLVALPRPPVLKRILADVTAMGIKQIYLINSQRVEKSFWNSRALRAQTILQQLVLGLEQACDTVLPEVYLRPYFKPFVEDELPRISQGRQGWAAHPGGDCSCPRQVRQPFVLAIGPEGGFIPYEIDKFRALRYSIVDLGQRILRVETAVTFLLGRLI